MANKENVRKWIEGLRSGRYTQGRGALNLDSSFCCLGVACEVAIENGLPLKKFNNEDGMYSYGGHASDLPLEVSEWLGLDFSTYYNPNVTPKLDAIGANDVHHLTFVQIADGLEKLYL